LRAFTVAPEKPGSGTLLRVDRRVVEISRAVTGPHEQTAETREKSDLNVQVQDGTLAGDV
jgi:hypothetical protein